MKTFHTELPVRFGDAGLARIMYFPHIINYLHIALEEFTQEALGVSYYSLINDKGYGFPHVNLQTRFIRGIPYGTHIQVEVGVVNIGNSSLTLRFRFYLIRLDRIRWRWNQSTRLCAWNWMDSRNFASPTPCGRNLRNMRLTKKK